VIEVPKTLAADYYRMMKTRLKILDDQKCQVTGGQVVPDCSVMEYFKILAYVNKVPSLATCTQCEKKFFTPSGVFQRDRLGAEDYLREKFAKHQCPRTQEADDSKRA
jgi:hypothetical protein